jgi:predicted amidophosphoribosyltransferase
MRCPSCHSENPENTGFCIECGAAYARRCLNCGFENLPQAKFCGRCGAALTELAASQVSGSGSSSTRAFRETPISANRSASQGCARSSALATWPRRP